MIQQAEEAARREKKKYKDVKSQIVNRVRMLSELKRHKSSSGSSFIDDEDLTDLDPLIGLLKQDIKNKNIKAADKLQQLAKASFGQSIYE
jgi:hypothetical protein